MIFLVLCVSCACLMGAALLLVLRHRGAVSDGAGRGRAAPEKQQGKEQPLPSSAPALDGALYLDMAATMLAAGLSVPAVLQQLGQLENGRHRAELAAVVEGLYRGKSWADAWAPPVAKELEGIREALGLTLSTGAPSAQLVRVLAQRQRRHRQRAYEKAAARLGVKLVVPLGACSLPSFICLGVVPVLIALLPSLF